MATKKVEAKVFDPVTIQHIVRLYNTNIDGNKPPMQALRKIKGIGQRFSRAVVYRSGIPANKLTGELTTEEIGRIQNVIDNPASFNIPSYMFNHQKDFYTGEDSHIVGIKLDGDLRNRIERGKKTEEIRALRLAAGLKVRGQMTKSNGRKNKATRTHKKK